MTVVLNLWKYRALILQNSINDLRNRYRGSVAGVLWNIFIPLAQIIVFSTIFSALMDYRAPGLTEGRSKFGFVIFLCAGLLPWNAFGDTLSRGVSSLVGNAGYLKKLALPEQIFVAQDTVSGFFSALLAIGLFMLFAVFVADYGPYWTWLQILPALVLFLAFAFGLGLLLSCLNVFFRDLQPMMGVVLLLWFWLTPIVYPIHVLESRPWIIDLLQWNPAFHYVRACQLSIEGRLVSPTTWAICFGVAAAFGAAGYLALRRLRAEIRDVL